MDNYFSLKYIISFFIGIIVYKLIQNKCSCGIIEGQSADDENIKESIINFLKNENNEKISSLIINFAKVTNTLDDEPDILMEKLSDIQSLSELGNPYHSEALDLVDLIIQNFLKMDPQMLKNQIDIYFVSDLGNMCQTDINLYLMMGAYMLYSNSYITSDSNIDSDDFVKILNISNRLSKYLPDILEKVQTLYELCPGEPDNTYDKNKAEILNRIYHRLFKNNETTINFNGFDKLIQTLKTTKTIYIALFMICFTFIIVKFIGIFNMGNQ